MKKAEKKIMVKVTNKSGQLNGFVTPEQFKKFIGVSSQTTRFLSDLCKEYSLKDTCNNYSIDLK